MTTAPRGDLVRIVGGGVAGISAAFAHLDAGYRVEVIEARAALGGRAWSRDGVDNGTHVILACYENFRRLLREIEQEGSFFRPETLSLAWLDEDAQLHRLRARKLPGPLGLLAGILGTRSLDLRTRLSLVRAGRAALSKKARDGEDVGSWLARLRIAPRARAILFEPLCRAIMNLEPEHACARVFGHTLGIAFRGGPRNAAIWVPALPWGEILDAPARARLEQRGARVCTDTKVTRVDFEDEHPILHTQGDGVHRDHTKVVLALPWAAAARICVRPALLGGASEIRSAPIVNLHLELPTNALPSPDPVLALEYGQPFHFVCRRPHTSGKLDESVPTCMIAGAAFALDGLPQREIIELGLAQLQRFTGRRASWPEEMRRTARVVRESSATIFAQPGIEALRPAPGPTSLPALALAGDWTATGLPSTLEGAARSGYASVP